MQLLGEALWEEKPIHKSVIAPFHSSLEVLPLPQGQGETWYNSTSKEINLIDSLWQ